MRRITRALSGVYVVAVMAKPFPCPHGRCIYCPGGPEFGTPQSYIGKEPALMRAFQVNYDPYEQVRTRLRQYEFNGHTPKKLDIVVMGGTFTAMPRDYQEWFITNIFAAANRYPRDPPDKPPTLEEAHEENERADIRIVGLTIETRPDWAMERDADWMLRLGATKVEIGVQSIYEDVLKLIHRGHGVREIIESTRILKDSGFKVGYHIMPGLPGSNFDRDIEMIKEIFENPDYRPDMLKIYPTLVIEGTSLYKMWREGLYKPLSDEEAVELISEFYRHIPRWVRIIRIQRDIPSYLISAGPKKSNLRELVEKRALEKGIMINDIRFREVSRQEIYRGKRPGSITVTREIYEASGGTEIFLAAEDPENSIVVGILRMRIPSEKAHRPEMKEEVAVIRELHVYGIQLPLGVHDERSWQHRGWGSRLLREAEEIARDKFGAKKILVLSGVGAREYYRKLGYYRPRESPYMTKDLA